MMINMRQNGWYPSPEIPLLLFVLTRLQSLIIFYDSDILQPVQIRRQQ